MTVVLIIFVAVVVIGIVGRRWLHRDTSSQAVISAERSCSSVDCSSCGSSAEGCGRERLMKAAVAEIEYFEDEELDAYIGRAADKYSDEEVAAFEEVMLTMRPEEIGSWLTSLTLRGINLPDRLKDALKK